MNCFICGKKLNPEHYQVLCLSAGKFKVCADDRLCYSPTQREYNRLKKEYKKMKVHTLNRKQSTFNRRQAFLFLAKGFIVGKIGCLSTIKDTSELTTLDKEVLSDNFYLMDTNGRILDRFNDEVELDELPCKNIYYLVKGKSK